MFFGVSFLGGGVRGKKRIKIIFGHGFYDEGEAVARI
jgi:hypothetical protein